MRHNFLFLCAFALVRTSSHALEIPANDSNIHYSGYVSMAFDAATGRMKFDRKIATPGKGYEWDNPGTRIAFRTNSEKVVARLYFSEGHISPTARNAVGRLAVDGKLLSDWQFGSSQKSILRQPENIEVELPSSAGGFHNYELILPYGDSVEFAGLVVDDHAGFEPVPTLSARYVALGDSVTQGFEASSIDHTYPYLLGLAKNWEVINLGIAGRRAVASDGTLAASLKADIITVHIGVNNWQGGGSLEDYRKNLVDMLANIRKQQPKVAVYLISPLWVNPTWKPPKANLPLEDYREVMRKVVADSKDDNLHFIEGSELIDEDPKLFSHTAVHPNDAGFAMMGERLAGKITSPGGQ